MAKRLSCFPWREQVSTGCCCIDLAADRASLYVLLMTLVKRSACSVLYRMSHASAATPSHGLPHPLLLSSTVHLLVSQVLLESWKRNSNNLCLGNIQLGMIFISHPCTFEPQIPNSICILIQQIKLWVIIFAPFGTDFFFPSPCERYIFSKVVCQ